jgi:hypothetical protein
VTRGHGEIPCSDGAAYNASVSRSTVVIELAADARFARDLAAGGVFVPGCALRLADECDLVVCGANHRLMLPARVVYVDEHRGAGLELVGFSIEVKAQLAELEPMIRPSLELVDEPFDAAAGEPAQHGDDTLPGFTEPVPLVVLEALDDDLELFIDNYEDDVVGGDPGHDSDANTSAYPQAGDGRADPADIYADDMDGDGQAGRGAEAYDTDAYPQVAEAQVEAAEHRTSSAGFDTDAYPQLPGSGDPGELADPDAETEPDTAAGGRSLRATTRPTQPLARNVHERLRGLTLVAQHKLAVSGELHERVMLERLYGKNVWETLLHNPRLTPPEVSRIARYGSLPRVLLEIIVGNNAWLQVPEVRRALLSNPRLGTDQVMKVLRLTPKHELKLAAIQTAYPATVRQVARLLLRGD